MKKMILTLFTLVLMLGLVGCGGSDKAKEAEVDINSPEFVTQSYIKLLNDYKYTEAAVYLTKEYNNRFTMLNELINDIKSYNMLGQENIEKGPDVVKTEDNQAKIWYEYAEGEYVYFQLVKEADLWKIGTLSLWSTATNGEPK